MYKRNKRRGIWFHIIHSYLNLVDKTSTFCIVGKEKLDNNQMVGYWHTDSYPMQLFLKKIQYDFKSISVIVTADKRGDYIEQMIESFGAKAFRVRDGLKMKESYSNMLYEAKKEGKILATALDGPLGPLHKPKRLLFLLAKQADKEMVYIYFTYSKCIRLKNRWDNYVIPLPFTKIQANVENIGKITNIQLNSIKNESFVLKYE